MSLGNPKLTLINSYDKLVDFHEWFGQRHECIAFDTETGGLHPWVDDLRLLQVGDTQAGWAFPWHGWGGAAMEAIHKWKGPLVAHNSGFDVMFIEHHSAPHYRWNWTNMHDTMYMAYVLDPRQSIALKNLATRYVDPKAASGQHALNDAMKQQGWGWGDIPLDFPMYWAYACLDVVLTANLYEHLAPQIGSFKDVYDLEIQVARIVSRMQRKGAAIDLEYTAQKAAQLASYVERGTAWCISTYGVRPSQGIAVADALVREGVQLSSRTPTGKYKLDEEVLKSISHPLASTALKVRKAQKLLSTYFTHFLEDHDNGILHPSINQIRARKTGRMSVNDPPLQTLPRGRVVRDCFIGRNGNQLILADYDQIEMRVVALLSEDPGLVEDILSGDLHTNTARKIYNDPELQKKDPRRQNSKNGIFARFYGAGVAKFAKTTGISVDEARRVYSGFDAAYPVATKFTKQVIAEGAAHLNDEGVAYVRTPLGRRNIADNEGAYKLVNYLVQGTAADILKEAMVRLDNAGVGEFMILPVHDELVFDVPTSEVEAVTQVIQEEMSVHGGAVPLTAGVDVVTRWGEKYA